MNRARRYMIYCSLSPWLLVTGCGSEVDSGKGEVPQLLGAQVGGCGLARIHDNGYTVYVTVDATCEDTTPLVAWLTWGTSEFSFNDQVVIDGFGQPVEFQFGPGSRRIVSVHKRGT